MITVSSVSFSRTFSSKFASFFFNIYQLYYACDFQKLITRGGCQFGFVLPVSCFLTTVWSSALRQLSPADRPQPARHHHQTGRILPVPLCLQGLCERQEFKRCLLRPSSPGTAADVGASSSSSCSLFPSSPSAFVTAPRPGASLSRLLVLVPPARVVGQCWRGEAGGPLLLLLVLVFLLLCRCFLSSDALGGSDQRRPRRPSSRRAGQHGRLGLPVPAEPRDGCQHRGSAAGGRRLQHGH